MPKFYTLQEANELLPRLTTLLKELQSRGAQLSKIGVQQAQIRRKIGGNGHHHEVTDAELHRAERPLEQALQTALALLTSWDIELKDLSRGLIDFPAMREGRQVFLCWELGEPEVGYWHEVDTGFSDRRPVDEQFL